MNARERFQQSNHVKALADITANPSFESGADYAMLVLLEEQPEGNDPSKAWDCHSQMVGAQKLLAILKTLHIPIEKPATTKRDTLHYA
jgi:hypothetical protein